MLLALAGLKLDLDVGGTKNSIEGLSIEYGTYEEVTGSPKPDWHSYDGVKYANKTLFETEGSFYSKDYESFIVSSMEENAWGAKKSYEINFDHTVSSQVFPKDHPITGPQDWAYGNLAVTQFKDEEMSCTYPSNFNIIGDPFTYTDLSKFKDGETIVDEDLVLWIMVGKQHYPKGKPNNLDY